MQSLLDLHLQASHTFFIRIEILACCSRLNYSFLNFVDFFVFYVNEYRTYCTIRHNDQQKRYFEWQTSLFGTCVWMPTCVCSRRSYLLTTFKRFFGCTWKFSTISYDIRIPNANKWNAAIVFENSIVYIVHPASIINSLIRQIHKILTCTKSFDFLNFCGTIGTDSNWLINACAVINVFECK